MTFSTVSMLTLFVLALGWVAADGRCNLPPHLWCSSKSVARDCQVERQCGFNVWSETKSADKVNLTLYYETLCPDCKVFVANQLWPTFQLVPDLFNLELVPYGNAHEVQVGDSWVFTCQHGPTECLGNLIQTCAIHVIGNSSKAFPFVACMERSDAMPESSAPTCAKLHGVDYEAVTSCVKSPLGNKLQHQLAVQTEQLNPPHQYVPWVTLNGVHTEQIEQEAESNLLKLICDTYKGEKPVACHNTRAPRRCVNH